LKNNEWQNIRYKIDPATKEIEVGTFPLPDQAGLGNYGA
jgi:hypothetical protein